MNDAKALASAVRKLTRRLETVETIMFDALEGEISGSRTGKTVTISAMRGKLYVTRSKQRGLIVRVKPWKYKNQAEELAAIEARSSAIQKVEPQGGVQ